MKLALRTLYLTTIMMLICPLCILAQKGSLVSGKVVEEDSGQAAIQAAVMLLSVADSTMADATVTDQNGVFVMRAVPGDYILKFATIGFVTRYINIHQSASSQGLDVGIVRLATDNIILESSKVTAQIEPVTAKDDTLIYHAAAYRVADGAGMDKLLKKIPGIEITPSGEILMNGKPVSELMVNGKSFFGNDVITGLKNLQADMVENIVTYENQSEYAKLSGIDDGEREPVINLTIRKSMMDGWRGNAILGGGSDSRYRARVNANNITGDSHKTFIANTDNCNGKMSFNNTSRSQVGSGGLGDAKDSKIGFSIAKEIRDLDYDGNIQYSTGKNDIRSHARSESFNGSGTSFNESLGKRESSHPYLTGDLKLKWSPDSLSTYMIKPRIQLESNNGWSQSQGRSFRSDPYEICRQTSEYMGFDIQDDPYEAIRLNGTDNASGTYGKRMMGSLTAMGSWKSPKKKGRTLSLQLSGTYQKNDSHQYSSYLTRYYNKSTGSLQTRKLLQSTEEESKQFMSTLSYSDKIRKGLYFQSSAIFEYRTQNMDKGVYDLFEASPDWSPVHTLNERKQNENLPDGYKDHPYDIFCSSGSYDWGGVRVSTNLRWVRKKFNMTAGAFIKPHKSIFHYPGDNGTTSSQSTSELNYGPVFTLRYVFNKSTNMTVRYQTSTGMPSMSQMLPIPAGTNPLYVSVGNPELKAPCINTVNLSFNSSDKNKKDSFICDITYKMTNDAISQTSTYDTETGIRTSSPVNIDGNWNLNGTSVYNKTFPGNRFSISNHTAAGYSNQEHFFYIPAKKDNELNVTTRFMAKELFEGSYRNNWLDVILGGGIEYTDERCSLRPEINQSPVTGLLNLSAAVDFPWKMRFEADFSTLFQRGYSYDELNRNYYVLNLELSQRIIRNGTFRLGWYDALKSLENMTRRFSTSSRSITTYNGVNSYVLASFIYSFKL